MSHFLPILIAASNRLRFFSVIAVRQRVSWQFFKEPGPVAYNFNLLDATVCESPDEFSYKATYQTLPSEAGSPINAGTVPTLGEFVGIAPVPPDGHIEFFMR